MVTKMKYLLLLFVLLIISYPTGMGDKVKEVLNDYNLDGLSWIDFEGDSSDFGHGGYFYYNNGYTKITLYEASYFDTDTLQYYLEHELMHLKQYENYGVIWE